MTFPAQAACLVHGDPLVCLACEAEEDARPEWQRPHRVTPPRLRGEPERTDVERLRQQAIFISETLHHAGIGPCTLTEGVQALVERAEKAEVAVDSALTARLRELLERWRDEAVKHEEMRLECLASSYDKGEGMNLSSKLAYADCAADLDRLLAAAAPMTAAPACDCAASRCLHELTCATMRAAALAEKG